MPRSLPYVAGDGTACSRRRACRRNLSGRYLPGNNAEWSRTTICVEQKNLLQYSFQQNVHSGCHPFCNLLGISDVLAQSDFQSSSYEAGGLFIFQPTVRGSCVAMTPVTFRPAMCCRKRREPFSLSSEFVPFSISSRMIRLRHVVQ